VIEALTAKILVFNIYTTAQIWFALMALHVCKSS